MTAAEGDCELRCSSCGSTSRADFASSLREGWPKCCGSTMTLEHTEADIDAAVGELVTEGGEAWNMDALREAVLAARACLLLQSARAYGLVEGGPVVNVERCERLIVVGLAAGLRVSEAEVSEAVADFVRGIGARA